MSKEQCKKCADAMMCKLLDKSGKYQSDFDCSSFRSKTWFDVLTSSIRKLAENFVYEIYVDDKHGYYYKSTIFDDTRPDGEGMVCDVGAWLTREEATDATIKRLKEEYHG